MQKKQQQDQSQIKWISDFIWNIADDRLLAYFASYSPRNADGRFAAQLVVRTYD